MTGVEIKHFNLLVAIIDLVVLVARTGTDLTSENQWDTIFCRFESMAELGVIFWRGNFFNVCVCLYIYIYIYIYIISHNNYS